MLVKKLPPLRKSEVRKRTSNTSRRPKRSKWNASESEMRSKPKNWPYSKKRRRLRRLESVRRTRRGRQRKSNVKKKETHVVKLERKLIGRSGRKKENVFVLGRGRENVRENECGNEAGIATEVIEIEVTEIARTTHTGSRDLSSCRRMM